jgi:hypothetical protein
VLGRQVKADRGAVVLHVERVLGQADLLGKAFDDLGEVVKGVSDTPHDPYFLPFSGTVTFLASRGCRITARRRVLVLSLGFRATRCRDPDGS